MNNHDEDSDKGYILETDVNYLKNICDFHNDLPFSLEGIKNK